MFKKDSSKKRNRNAYHAQLKAEREKQCAEIKRREYCNKVAVYRGNLEQLCNELSQESGETYSVNMKDVKLKQHPFRQSSFDTRWNACAFEIVKDEPVDRSSLNSSFLSAVKNVFSVQKTSNIMYFYEDGHVFLPKGLYDLLKNDPLLFDNPRFYRDVCKYDDLDERLRRTRFKIKCTQDEVSMRQDFE